MRSSHRGSFAAALIVAVGSFAALGPTARAQCFGPDNLNGPCCAPAQVNLPPFPAVAFPGMGLCIDQCTPTMKNDIRVVWGPPSMSQCGEFSAPMSIIDSTTGVTLLTGKLVLEYTRTWSEVNPAGNVYQVWRFVARADLTGVAGVAPVCPMPSCTTPVGPHSGSFFYGYIDYALQCGTTLFENAVVLYHACDFFIHKPGLSSRPGAFHPGRAYAIIGPHDPGQVFTPMSSPAPAGPLVAEAVRNTRNPLAPTCSAEDPIASGARTPFAAGCVCLLSTAPPQQTLSVLAGKGNCVDATGNPNSFASQFLLFPTIPWPHLVTTTIGCWTNGNRYPGKECAFVEEGLFQYHDACPAGTAGSGDSFEVFYGGSTTNGWTVLPTPINALTQNFTDLANNYQAVLGAPASLPILGHIGPTEHLIYVNTP